MSDVHLIRDGFIFAPLKVDTSILEEIAQTKHQSWEDKGAIESPIITYKGDTYVQTIHVDSLGMYVHATDPSTFDEIRDEFFADNPDPMGDISVDNHLEAAVFETMPYFIRVHDDFERRKPTTEEVIELIQDTYEIPAKYSEKAQDFLDTDLTEVQKFLRRDITEPIHDGIYTEHDEFQEVLYRGVVAEVEKTQKDRVQKFAEGKKGTLQKKEQYVSTLLFIQDSDEFKIQDFGIRKLYGERFAYVSTGEYVLRRKKTHYKFNSCDVGVNIKSPAGPRVLNRYTHPFLESRSEQGQEICLGNKSIPRGHEHGQILINHIEAGLETILRGYIGSPDPVHPYKYLNNDVFEGYKITADDARITSGELEVTNDFGQPS